MVSNNKGFVMVVSMVMLVVLTVLGMGGLMLSGFQQDISGRMRCRTSSLQCAEVGRTMVMGRYNPNINTSAFPFPAILDINLPTACRIIYTGHITGARVEAGSPVTEFRRSGVSCTNNVGCGSSELGSKSVYRTIIVGQAENCEPVEIEVLIEGMLGGGT